MPTRDSAPFGAPVWIELSTSDVERARAFYAGVFGWQAAEPDPQMGGYFNFSKDDAFIAGGMVSQPDTGVTDVWATYLATDDTRKTVEAAASHGAQVIAPPMDVMDLGVMAVVADPGGAAIGIWQPGTHPGFRTYMEPSSPSWFELHTRDYAAAVDFYRDVFHLDTEVMGDTDQFRYTVLSAGGQQLAGVVDDSGNPPDERGAHWAVYFGSADTDATLDKVTALGGRILRPAEDTPWGRLAEVADPMGCRFHLQAPNEAMPAK